MGVAVGLGVGNGLRVGIGAAVCFGVAVGVGVAVGLGVAVMVAPTIAIDANTERVNKITITDPTVFVLFTQTPQSFLRL